MKFLYQRNSIPLDIARRLPVRQVCLAGCLKLQLQYIFSGNVRHTLPDNYSSYKIIRNISRCGASDVHAEGPLERPLPQRSNPRRASVHARRQRERRPAVRRDSLLPGLALRRLVPGLQSICDRGGGGHGRSPSSQPGTDCRCRGLGGGNICDEGRATGGGENRYSTGGQTLSENFGRLVFVALFDCSLV